MLLNVTSYVHCLSCHYLRLAKNLHSILLIILKIDVKVSARVRCLKKQMTD